jgi:hypothetical protein
MMDGGMADLVWASMLVCAFMLGWYSEHGW